MLRGNNYIGRSTLVATAYVLFKASDESTSVDSVESFCSSISANEDRCAFLDSFIGDMWQMVIGQRYSVQ